METIQGVTFEGEAFSIDNKNLVDCTFINCTIKYGGKAVTLQRTVLTVCKFVSSQEARMTLEFLECVRLLPKSDLYLDAAAGLVH